MNTLAEDICVVIGYSATSALIDWFGGRQLHIPLAATEDHAIAKVIGLPAFTRLVAEWRGKALSLPLDYQRERDRRDRMIAVLIAHGHGSKEIAKIVGMSERGVQYSRQRLEEMGVLELILKKAGLERLGENRVPKVGSSSESSGKNRGQKVGQDRAGKRGRRPW